LGRCYASGRPAPAHRRADVTARQRSSGIRPQGWPQRPGGAVRNGQGPRPSGLGASTASGRGFVNSARRTSSSGAGSSPHCGRAPQDKGIGGKAQAGRLPGAVAPKAQGCGRQAREPPPGLGQRRQQIPGAGAAIGRAAEPVTSWPTGRAAQAGPAGESRQASPSGPPDGSRNGCGPAGQLDNNASRPDRADDRQGSSQGPARTPSAANSLAQSGPPGRGPRVLTDSPAARRDPWSRPQPSRPAAASARRGVEARGQGGESGRHRATGLRFRSP